jgi:hypothetical protein
MNPELILREKRDSLKSGLEENLQKKHALELRISEQFEELKRLEIWLEKCSQATVTKG